MPPFRNIYCIIKLSELDYYKVHDRDSARLEKLSESKRKEIDESHKNQKDFLDRLKEIDKELGLQIIYVNEQDCDQIQPTAEDLILTAGGDGTFLKVAQRFDHVPLLGMNSDHKPKAGYGSHGALTKIKKTNLRSRLKKLKRGEFEMDRWNRLEACINGRHVGRYAINDIYYGQKISYKTCNIIVEQSGQIEEFNSSGILCCTGMGSHAWHYNAGGSPFSNDLDAFGFRVLFPNLKRPLKFTSGIVSARNQVVITPERDHYVLCFDSHDDVIETELGDKIAIRLAPEQAIQVIRFNNSSTGTT